MINPDTQRFHFGAHEGPKVRSTNAPGFEQTPDRHGAPRALAWKSSVMPAAPGSQLTCVRHQTWFPSPPPPGKLPGTAIK